LKGLIPTLERTFSAVHQVMEKQPLERQAIRVRLDSGHDAKDTRAWLYDVDSPRLIDFIIKWNPRKEASIDNKEKWFEYAHQLGALGKPERREASRYL